MLYKLIIIGSGPAGYTAGIYAGRAGLKPLLFAGEKSGGQLIYTNVVENWPGADEGITGSELMMKMREQAIKFGTKIIDKDVVKVDFTSKAKAIHLGGEDVSTSEVFKAQAVIIATGAESSRLHLPGEDRLFGRGVATCAVCDAPFYKDKIAAVLGGGDSACEESLALTKFAKKVYLIHRRDELRAAKVMAERVKNNLKIEILWKTEVKEILGEQKVEGIKLADGREIQTDGVFLALGHKPATEIFRGKMEMDEAGYIKTFNNTMTSIPGIFAAGDCVDYRYRQAITAAGTGCQAAIDAERWLESQGR